MTTSGFVGAALFLVLCMSSFLCADELKPWSEPAGKPKTEERPTEKPAAKQKNEPAADAQKKAPEKPAKPATPDAQTAKDKAEAACLAGCNKMETDGSAACSQSSSLPPDEDCEKKIASAAGRCRAGCHQ